MSDYLKEDKRIMKIWGRECEVEIIFDCFDDEDITLTQKKAYQDFINAFDSKMKEAYEAFEKYCKQENNCNISDNIFKYVVPKTIYIQRSPKDEKVIGFICYYKYDSENNIAIKFVNNTIADIGGEQIVL